MDLLFNPRMSRREFLRLGIRAITLINFLEAFFFWGKTSAQDNLLEILKKLEQSGTQIKVENQEEAEYLLRLFSRMLYEQAWLFSPADKLLENVTLPRSNSHLAVMYDTARLEKIKTTNCILYHKHHLFYSKDQSPLQGVALKPEEIKPLANSNHPDLQNLYDNFVTLPPSGPDIEVALKCIAGDIPIFEHKVVGPFNMFTLTVDHSSEQLERLKSLWLSGSQNGSLKRFLDSYGEKKVEISKSHDKTFKKKLGRTEAGYFFDDVSPKIFPRETSAISELINALNNEFAKAGFDMLKLSAQIFSVNEPKKLEIEI